MERAHRILCFTCLRYLISGQDQLHRKCKQTLMDTGLIRSRIHFYSYLFILIINFTQLNLMVCSNIYIKNERRKELLLIL